MAHRFLTLAAAALLSVVCSITLNAAEGLVGTWSPNVDATVAALPEDQKAMAEMLKPMLMTMTVEFMADGNVNTTMMGQVQSGTYVAENGTLTITMMEEGVVTDTNTASYTLNGDVLTVAPPNEPAFVFSRVVAGATAPAAPVEPAAPAE